jgi:SAM-dependent methyltransferase
VSSRSVGAGVSDSAYVRRQYETETGLAARKSIYEEVTGADARQLALDAVAETAPQDVLEVGCGEGELADRIAQELDTRVVAIDQSERMVELTNVRGVDARIGDVQELPFADGSFDVVLAAWMLYHVPDLDHALAEIVRVLRPGGRLVAVTNHPDHLHEMFRLVGLDRWALPFDGQNGAAILGRFFARVEQRDADGTVVLRDAAAVRRYLGSSERLSQYVDRVPELTDPLVVRRRPIVFVAER